MCYRNATIRTFTTKGEIQHYEKGKNKLIIIYNDRTFEYTDIETYNGVNDSSYFEITNDIERDGDTIYETDKKLILNIQNGKEKNTGGDLSGSEL